LESDADGQTGQEIFLLSYNSFADLVNNTFASATFSQLNVNPAFSVGGLAAIYDNSGGGNGSVPEPPTAILTLIALSLFGLAKRRWVNVRSCLDQNRQAAEWKPLSMK
jgi:hypothetical protein